MSEYGDVPGHRPDEDPEATRRRTMPPTPETGGDSASPYSSGGGYPAGYPGQSDPTAPYGQQPGQYGQQPAQPGPPPAGQPAYGQGLPPQNPYGAQPPGAVPPGYGPPGAMPPGAVPPNVYGGPYAAPPMLPPDFYASWGDRAVATLWDFVYSLPPVAVTLLGALLFVPGAWLSQEQGALAAIVMILAVVIILAGVAWSIWRLIDNSMLDQGRTGYTYGKRKVGIRFVTEATGQPPGVGLAVAKYFLHGVINQFCYIDYLWPLWDEKRQTLTDKVLNTIVVRQLDPSGPSPMFGKRK